MYPYIKNIERTVFLILFMILISSCENEERALFPLSSHIKEWASFGEGSYWVYQNDSTLQIDSVYVGFNGTEIYPSAENTYDVQTVNTTITDDAAEMRGFIFALGAKEIVFQDWNEINQAGSSAGLNLQDEDVVEEDVKDADYIWNVQYYEEMEVNGLNYTDVAFISVRDSVNYVPVPYRSYKYWIAKNYWMIKKCYTIEDSVYSWSLVRCSINQD